MTHGGKSTLWWRVVAAAVGLTAVAALSLGLPHAQAPKAVATTTEKPLLTLVSMPDFLNTDVGDTRLRAGSGWDPGDPTSITPAWTRATDVILDQVRSENPDAVLVAGDLVEGHWGSDVDATGIFGPVGTTAERLAAVSQAADFYYGQWKHRFEERDLHVLPAVGDHEIGDNPWPVSSFKYAAVPTYKAAWARNFSRDGSAYRYPMRPVGTPFESTAYAVRLENTLIVTVDVFDRGPDGVHARVVGGQLRWLDGLLGQARADGVEHIIVQGHTPVLSPARARHSSRIFLEGGTESPFWQVLRRHHVDLYLCGEMHDITTHTDGGVVQIVHGALSSAGQENYLLARVYRDHIDLAVKEFHGRVTDRARMWAATRKRPARGVAFDPHPPVVGTMTIDKSHGKHVLRDRTGRLSDD